MRKISLPIFFFLCITYCWSQDNTKLVDSLFTQLGKAKNDISKAKLCNELSHAYQTTDLKKSNKYATLTLRFSQKSNYTKGICQYYSIMANNSLVAGNNKKAEDFF